MITNLMFILLFLYVGYMLIREVMIWIGQRGQYDRREISGDEFWDLKNERGTACTTEGFVVMLIVVVLAFGNGMKF